MTPEQRRALRERVSAALKAKHKPVGGCAGCGTPLNNKTQGCETCWERHYRRALRAGNRVDPTCSACGCPADDQTPRCRTCYWRHYSRRRVA